MRPELFVIPFINVSVKSYGFMMVLGFAAALLLARWRSRKLGENPAHITDFGVMILLAGVVGARLHHVLHRLGSYIERPWEIVAIWEGGLEFLGGFILAVIVAVIYFRRKHLPALRYLDILAPAVMLGLSFGRIGCFLNGCCFGGPCELPWAVRFPVANSYQQGIGCAGCEHHEVHSYSHPYRYQITPDEHRRVDEGPLIVLPENYYWDYQGQQVLKEPGALTPEQLAAMREGPHRMIPIHPTQLYSSINALLLCLVLNGLFRFRKRDGEIFAAMLILYGITRFAIESIRVDSPLGFTGLTISQNLGILAVLGGIGLLVWVRRRDRRETGGGV